MRSSFAKSIYVGAAVLGLAGLSAVTTTTASAKSYATAGAYTALADKSQNVTVTGTNAIYSKPGTVKGAKVVASKKTVAKLAASKKSSDTFYAYGTKTTNRGSVYYKIVTMDKKYRGYVYAGKTAGTFTAGIKAAETTTAATTPARTTGYYLKDVSKNTLWTAPKNTDIHAKKVSLYGASKTDPFTVDKAATKTKEGSLYYHVTDSKDSSISGWIYAGKGFDASITDNTKQDLGGLSLTVAANAATSDNSVNVVYRDASTKANVGTATWVDGATTSTTKAGDPVGTKAVNTANQSLVDYIKAAKPANYAVSSRYTVSAQYGTTVYVDVTATATSKVALKVDKVDTTTATVVNGLAKNATLSTKDVTVSGFDATTLDGDKTANVDLTKVENSLKKATLTGTKTYYTIDGTAYHYEFKLTVPTDLAKDNPRAVYGDTLNAYYTATLKLGSANTTTSSDGWIA
ncbi:S-layer protein [Levilactobacillus mulengensis]|uniref:S-layer protein n=1 Tax=Levilactobacillus mulengensis TaxID=2486025 RepID=UPI000F77A396|nr:S-layer protein [Levilactobacillus mulengensis]